MLRMRSLSRRVSAKFGAIVIAALSLRCDPDFLILHPLEAAGAPMPYSTQNAAQFLEAAVVGKHALRNVDDNILAMGQMVDEILAAHPSTRLVVFGEDSLGFYYEPSAPSTYKRAVAQPIPGPATDALGMIARRHGIYLAFGMAELRGDTMYNAGVAIDPQGQVIGVHTKGMLIDWDKESGFTERIDPTVVQIDGIRTGIRICAESSSEALTLAYVDARPEMMLSLQASFEPGPFTVDMMARRLNAWTLFANRVGEEGDVTYPGLVYISDPAGNTVVGDAKPTPRYHHTRIGIVR